jgi:hypothetical protein
MTPPCCPGSFDPTVRDGLATRVWSSEVELGPAAGHAALRRLSPSTGGITFTFGGVKVNERAPW